MAMTACPLTIVGCGPGAAEYLTDAARQAVALAEVLAGSSRLLAMFPGHAGRKITIGSDLSSATEEIASHVAAGRNVAVLVSGDPGCFSLSRRMVARFGRGNCRVVPGISAVQVAFARLGLDWADARLLSAHGRTPDIRPEELARCDKVAIFAGNREAIEWSAVAAAAVATTHAAFLCENLTLADERMEQLAAEKLYRASAASLSLVLLVRRSLVP